jgi:hypothetical protein
MEWKISDIRKMDFGYHGNGFLDIMEMEFLLSITGIFGLKLKVIINTIFLNF